jgi:hypothetical protein
MLLPPSYDGVPDSTLQLPTRVNLLESSTLLPRAGQSAQHHMVKIRTLPALTRVVVLESQLTFFADVTPSIIRWSSGYIAAFDESEFAYSRSLHHYLFLQVSSPTTMAEIRTPRTFDISD